MLGREVYKIWAPNDAKWTQWVRPVPFVSINDEMKVFNTEKFEVPNINYISDLKEDTAIIVDVRGVESIKEGIALGKIGYRPIPVYNGTNEQKGALSTVNNEIIEFGLIKGAKLIKELKISKNAPPVFLLDSNRLNRFIMDASVFDNSWDIYSQDLPTAKYFLENGINKIIIRAEKVNKDLNKILYKFQKEGIKILFTNGYDAIREIRIKRNLFFNI